MSFQFVPFIATPRSQPRSGALTPGTLRQPPTSLQYLPSHLSSLLASVVLSGLAISLLQTFSGCCYPTEYSSNSELFIQGPSSWPALLRCAFHSCVCLLNGLTLFELLTGTWCCANQHFICIISFNPFRNPMRQDYFHSPFTDEETEAQKVNTGCPRCLR